MDTLLHNINKASTFLKTKIEHSPEILIIAGTGLGRLSNLMLNCISVKYKDILGFPETTVESHDGQLVFGTLNGKRVALMLGRFHLYEGYSPTQITFPIRVLHALGVKTMIITNASGGINLSFKEGNIMVIEDHINLTGNNPLIGQDYPSLGLRFPDMINAYDRTLIKTTENLAAESGIPICKGVYAGLTGPSLETPAEIRFLKTIGADSVGFSTIQEVIAAVHVRMKVLGLSVITNINNPDNPIPATLEEVIETAGKTTPLLETLIGKIVENLNDE